MDLDTGKLRPTTKADVAMSAGMVDVMDEIDVNLRAVGAHDVDPQTAPLHNVEVLLANTTKSCFIGPMSGFLVKKLAQMAAAIVGGSSPVNMAGTMVTHNAEVLAGIMLGQATVKGAPMIYGSSTTAMDLRFGSASVGTPECAVINAAVARLGNYYGLPTWVAGG